MKRPTIALFVLSVLCFLRCLSQQPAADSIHLADPTILYSKGTYYLYGTVEGNSGMGFLVYTSRDAKNWTGPSGASSGYALKKGEAFGTANFWAPQVFDYRGKYYMAYAANENIAIAEAPGPLGPFRQTTAVALPSPVKQIDPFVFIDSDGRKYLYHVRLQEGNRIFVAELHDDFSGIKEETLRECLHAEAGWENTANAKWPVAEGPSVIKRGGLYYLLYSANDFRNPDYAVGYAVASSPYGPWKKYEGNPVLGKLQTGVNGSGHGDLVKLAGNRLLYVFHTHNSNKKVGPRTTAIINVDFKKQESISNPEQFTVQASSLYFPLLK